MDSGEVVGEENDYRNAVIVFILNAASSKLPFKQNDIVEALDKKALKHGFQLAREALLEDYGILVKEVKESKAGKRYICYATESAKSPHEYDAQQLRHLTLLFLVLSYIFMNGCPVYESQLEDFLKGLKIYFDCDHSYFGSDIKKLITDTFVKQLYLKKEKSHSEVDTETKFLYSWGFRSTIEFKPKLVLEATAKILNKPANYFVAQYSEAHAAESDNDDDDDEEEEEL